MEGLRETIDNVEIRVGENTRGFVAELWGDIPAQHAISIRTPGGEITPKVDFREQNSREFLFIYDKARVQVDHVLVEQKSGEELIFFRFVDPSPGVWTVQVTITENSGSNSRFHMWLPLTEFLGDDTYFLRPSPYYTLTEPSNVEEVITTTTYNDVNGSFWMDSGRGFSRLGEIKPDICSPGVNISTVLGPRTGSSMAVAIASGASALFLQWAVVERNQIRVESLELKHYLMRGADRMEGERYPNREWGDYDIIVSSQQGASKIKVFRWFSPNIFSLQKQ